MMFFKSAHRYGVCKFNGIQWKEEEIHVEVSPSSLWWCSHEVFGALSFAFANESMA